MSSIRELTPEEINIVNGGVGVPGVAIGAVTGGITTYMATGSYGAAAGGALLGGGQPDSLAILQVDWQEEEWQQRYGPETQWD